MQESPYLESNRRIFALLCDSLRKLSSELPPLE